LKNRRLLNTLIPSGKTVQNRLSWPMGSKWPFLFPRTIHFGSDSTKKSKTRPNNDFRAGFANQASYQWRGSTDIDFAVDENGLWAIYATEANSWNIVVSKLDHETLEVKDTWNTAWKKAWSGNAFMICGQLYVLKKYNEKTTFLHYSFDTKTGRTSRNDYNIS